MPLEWVEFVIVFQFIIQLGAAFVHLFGFFEESLSCYGEKFRRVGRAVFI